MKQERREGPGRPKSEKIQSGKVLCSLFPEELEGFKTLCNKEGLPPSTKLRQLVIDHIRKKEIECETI